MTNYVNVWIIIRNVNSLPVRFNVEIIYKLQRNFIAYNFSSLKLG